VKVLAVFKGTNQSRKKEASVEEKGGWILKLFRPVTRLLCKIGLGQNACRDEWAVAKTADKYRLSCDLHSAGARALEIISNMGIGVQRNEGLDRAGVLSSYEALTGRVQNVLDGLEQLTGRPFDSLSVRRDEIDEAVRNALSAGDGRSFQDVERALGDIVTSYLPESRGANLRSEGCRTLHDMVRFAMETARQTMFDLCTSIQPGDRLPKQLVAEVPMQYWVVDLDGAVKAGLTEKKVRLEDIVCPPLHALWRGLTAVPWAGPPPVNARGFLSVMFECTRDPCLDPAVVRGFAGRNYIVVSRRFCSLTSRLGFHFATAAAYLGKDARESYVAFQFRGGAACAERRERRVRLISRILQQFGFFTDIEKDDLYARIEGQQEEYLEKCLVVLGHVMTHTRQLDMAMCNDAIVDLYYDEIMKGIASLAPMT